MSTIAAISPTIQSLAGRAGQWGGVARDNRRFVNAVLWTLRTGMPWRDLPPAYGDWKNTHRHVCRWRDRGVWEAQLDVLIDEPDFEWLKNTRADCAEANALIRRFEAEHLIAGKGYDNNAIVERAQTQGMPAQIPSRVCIASSLGPRTRRCTDTGTGAKTSSTS